MGWNLNEEFEDFARDCEDAADNVEEQMREGIEETAVDVRRRMKEHAPSSSGTLERSITANKTPTSHDVTYSVGPLDSVCDYAKYVEYGTGKHGPTGESYYITPGNLDPQEALAAEESGDTERVRKLAEEHGAIAWDGNDHPVIVVEHPGSEAQSFFRRTFSEAVEGDWLVENVEDKVGPMIEVELRG